MKPARHDLTIYQGDTFGLWFRIRLANGTVADPPNIGDGYTFGRLTVRDTYGGTAQLVCDTDNGLLVLGLETDASGAQWSGHATAGPEATDIEAWGDGVYDLKISDGVHVHTVLFGTARLHLASTEELPS